MTRVIAATVMLMAMLSGAQAQMVPMRHADGIERRTVAPSLFRFREADVAPADLSPLAKPERYVALWAEAMQCVQPFVRRTVIPAIAYDSVRFALVNRQSGFLVHGLGPFIGYTFTHPGDTHAEIWILQGWEWNDRLVKHEMLHAILGHKQDPVHPDDVGRACGVW